MKKLISGLIAALLLTAGFVAVSGGAVQAAQCGGAYPPCGGSDTTVTPTDTTIAPGDPIKFVADFATPGTSSPDGTATITITRLGPARFASSAHGYHKKFKVKVQHSDHGKLHFKSPKLTQPGTYKAVITFDPKNPRLKKSKDSFKFTVS